MNEKPQRTAGWSRRTGLLAWVACITLFVLSVPWYHDRAAEPRLWFGMPDWVVMSLAACVAIAIWVAVMIRWLWPPPGAAEGRPGENPEESRES